MGYYIRVLGTDNKKISQKSILKSNSKIGSIEIVERTFDSWNQIIVKNKDGDILIIEKNEVFENSLGQNELEEFKEEIENCHPKTAVNWLKKYFEKIKVIYALKILNEACQNDNWQIVTSVQEVIWHHVGGIFQSDNEGFSNEEGYHILWQFDDDVSGTWNMAVLNQKGEWESFVMDLGDREHRRMFKEGRKIK